jgi:type I restriction enzyme S subunit
MGKYKRYERYKDSGVEWIGEVPEGWRKSKIAWCFNMIGSGCTPNSTNEEFYDGDINWLITGDLNDGTINFTSKKITKLALKEYSTLKLYSKNSLVVAMYGATIGKLGITNIETATNQACCVLTKPRDANIKYMFYWFLANRNEIVNLSQGGGQPNISQNLIKDLKIYKPSIKEQTQIADFLDQKTSEIDALVADKEKLIILLEEKRQAIITEAVTKGLDPNVKMKDSGVEWIGEVPVHWNLSKIKYQAYINSITLEENTDKELEIKYIDISSVNSNGEVINIENYYFENAPSRARRIIKKGDTIVSTVRTYLKAIAWFENVEDNMICSTGFAVLSPKNGICPKYLFYLMRSTNYIDEIVKRSTGVSYPAITATEIGTIECLLPYKEEQIDIVRYIDDKIEEINVLIELINQQIQKLKEYRQSLISEAVTGKIDLRDKAGRFDD